MIIKFLMLGLFSLIASKEVILSAGIGNYTEIQLMEQYLAYKSYTNIDLITAASILTYQLTTDGMLAEWKTEDPTMTAEQFQYLIKKNLGLKSYPCVFCDATSGACTNLSDRIDNMIANKNKFIENSIIRAQRYYWDGYIVDFEPENSVNTSAVTEFIIEWGTKLNLYNMTLGIWVGGLPIYDLNILSKYPYINIITMSTYVGTYNDFITNAAGLQTQLGISNLSYGLLTYPMSYSFNETDLILISEWLKLTKSNVLSLWASNIPPTWYKGLHKFLHD